MPAPRMLRVAPKFNYLDSALVIPVGTLFEDWQREGLQLQQTRRSIMWHLGDWALWGDEHFGELYAQAVEEYSIESLQTAMRVCRRIPPQRRRDELGFSHHQLVAKFEPKEQDELLAIAVDKGWKRDELREEVSRRSAALKAAEAERAPPLPESGSVVHFPRAPGHAEQLDPRGASSDLPEPAEMTEGTPGLTGHQILTDPEREDIDAATGSADDQGLYHGNGMSAADAAAYIEQTARAALPDNMARAVMVLIEERARLRKVLHSAKIAIEMNFLTPGLRDAVAEAVASE